MLFVAVSAGQWGLTDDERKEGILLLCDYKLRCQQAATEDAVALYHSAAVDRQQHSTQNGTTASKRIVKQLQRKRNKVRTALEYWAKWEHIKSHELGEAAKEHNIDDMLTAALQQPAGQCVAYVLKWI